ncbi:MAG TPA: hypothetical protein D7H99_07605 [Candidatus Poseidoniales archaeon]|nr:MAG TPA: hypothetical protein D7H99_07605 [Candidatus Poseidoniales archaeon]HII58818.1 hypothetical protein [Candidatus Poseidoniaceae archaeon]|tara:strand:+ start:516 stop:1457 length:942 start_codon:yes stop_codon:yes gene_type:complete
MTDGQSYYDGLIAQGYPADQALGYTQQYYPGFVSQAAAPTPMPIPAPMPVQPIAQPQAIPQPMMQQPVQQMAQPMMNTAPMAVASMGEPKPIMAWAAVGCIAAALILCMMGQFGNSWQVSEENDSLALGLRNIVIDCSEQQNEEGCISIAYTLVAEDMEKAAAETPPSDPLVKGKIKNYCENSYEALLALAIATDDDTIRAEAGEDRETCLKNDSAGGITGIILWIGILGILASTVMLVMSILGKTLPGGVENYGRMSSWVSGALILFAAILWMIMKDNMDDNLNNGMSFYFALFAGLFAIGAGVLDLLDKRE